MTLVVDASTIVATLTDSGPNVPLATLDARLAKTPGPRCEFSVPN